MKTERDLWTVTRMAERLGVARHRLEYLIDARGIEPAARYGIARVFHAETIEVLRRELAQLAADRKGVGR